MKMKLVCLIYMIGMSHQIYDYPTMMNPTLSESYMRMNGGVGSQGYWSNLQPSAGNIFSPTWSTGGQKSMYNINSLAPYNGDRYTGYDSLTQSFAPQGTPSNFYHPTSGNVNGDTGLSPNMADFNSPMYRNFYQRYFNFYNKNLDLLNAKLKQKYNPLDFEDVEKRKKLTPNAFDFGNNYFDGKPAGDSLMGTNLPNMNVVSRFTNQARKLSLRKKPTIINRNYLKALREKVGSLKRQIFEIEDLETQAKQETGLSNLSV